MPEEPTAEADPATPPPQPAAQLEGGAYEIIRNRLAAHGGELRSRLGKLNADRQAVFGAIDPALLATERITTQHNCTARDIIAIGRNRFLFGYNVQLGLKSTTELSDVFAAYAYDPESHAFAECPFAEIIDGLEDFAADFAYVYKYYRETIFAKFMVIGPHLYMGFRIGKAVEDIKAFKFLKEGGRLTYLGNRFDHEYAFPAQQEFAWKRAHRDMHRSGVHPHISIEDRVFVETVGGDLTIKIEDNTESGEGIYVEPVDNPDQTLDDAETFYAVVGTLIILKIRPYQEKKFRYLVYNEKVKSVRRLDAIEYSCVLLPDDHGIIFSNGYHLQGGETKVFESDLSDMLFDRRIASSNGEDHLFVFYNRLSGTYILMPYNLIQQKVESPIVCNGYSLFEDGRLLYFRDEPQPQKHHAIQIWRTPYTGEEFVASEKTDSFLYKIGNAAIVRGMAECYEVLNLIARPDTYADLYVDLVKKTGDITDAYFWVAKPEAHDLRVPLGEINNAAQAAIAEFDKVQRLRKSAEDATRAAQAKARKIIREVEHSSPEEIMVFVRHLAELRTCRGEVIALRDMRYIDGALVEALEGEIVEVTEKCSQKCVEFLLKPEALDPYRAQVGDHRAGVPKFKTAAEGNKLDEEVGETAGELELLIDIVGNLKIEDATQTTRIIDGISEIYSELNQVRAELRNRKRELGREEGIAQFGAQMKLLNQAVVNYLDLCHTPEKTEEYLTKVMVQIEELEGKFADYDEFVGQLAEKRDEVYNAFESKKVALVEARNRRASNLMASAERILNGIRHRAEGMAEITEIHGYFAGDLMVEKVRDLVDELENLGDSVKAADVQTRLKTIREDAVRQLKDRKELFADGKNIIQFGKHKFSVNTQDLELTVVRREDDMFLHLAGTNFFEKITDADFLGTRLAWDQEAISENGEVYRGEFLAWQLYKIAEAEGSGAALLAMAEGERVDYVRKFMAPRYAEGYTKGVHDLDGEKIFRELLRIGEGIGLLRFDSRARALGLVFWECLDDAAVKARLAAKIGAFGEMRRAFAGIGGQRDYIAELARRIADYAPGSDLADQAAEYLFHELTDPGSFAVSPEAAELDQGFRQSLAAKRLDKKFEAALKGVDGDPGSRFEIIRDWLRGYAAATDHAFEADDYLDEAAAHWLRGGFRPSDVQQVSVECEIEGMLGMHPAIGGGKRYALHFNRFADKLRRFEAESVPAYQRYADLKKALAERARERMKLDEFKPRVMSAFVRNKLIDQVYLPLIGDNLAKQIGTAGADARTDRMGMLLLISPPGYGKTTLMEYIANRLGITFMKINGPAIGHQVTSLDPDEAPNASAREEVNKLNLALEMGDNVMIYLDDIQHCNPEFLQKFISLCDAQRKIEGVYKGVARTYDLRGKKVAVVMAGNPYTESGGKFQIPDMLANRADTYNLGDIIGGSQDAFVDSYIENALTSNPALNKLASRSQKDVYAFMRLAASGSQEGVDFEGNYAPEEVEEFTVVLKKLMRVRDTILRVNQEYIRSAAQADDYRTEPPFKLQGSYRNMNRIAEKILALMTEGEVEQLLRDHYENESQNLTTEAEANLLKFYEMERILSAEQAARWEAIKKTFNKNKLLGGKGEDDPVARIVAQMSAFTEGVENIRDLMRLAVEHNVKPATLADATVERLEQIIANLRAVPVDVEIRVLPVEESGGDSGAKPAKKKAAAKKADQLPVEIESKVEQGE